MSSKTSSIVFKPGDDISWAGVISRQGITDFTGYQLKAHFRTKNPRSSEPDNLLAAANIDWLEPTAGTFLLTVDRADTAKWPTGILVMLDISILDTAGKRVRTETVEIKTQAGVTTSV